MTTFYKNYISLCARAKKSLSGAAEEIGLSRTSPNGWKNGKIPSAVNLEKLSQYFGVTTEYLLGNEEQKKPDDQKAIGLNDTRYVDLNAENKAMIDALIERLYKSQSGE